MASPARSLALLVIALCVISKDAAGRRLNLERAEPLVAPTAVTSDGPAPEEINPIFERFRWAVKYIERTQELGVFPKWMCPDEAKVGARPKSHTPDVIGTKCEPWIARPAITLLHELLLPGTARALEWGGGSSTLWLLGGHVSDLITIEHNPGWVLELRAQAYRMFGDDYLKHWTLRFSSTHAEYGDYVDSPAEDVAAYVAAGVQQDELGTYDLAVVDGRGRAECVARAVELLTPSGGILVVDNAEQPALQAAIRANVPRRWLRFDAVTPQGTTSVFLTCPPGASC